MLESMLKILGNRKISISREISKKFEEVIRGNIEEVIRQMNNIKGEYVITVEGNKDSVDYTKITIIDHVNSYIKAGNSINEAIKLVAKDRGVSKKEIYNEYHGIKK